MSKDVLTPTAIARKINRSPAGVIAALKRLDIAPAFQSGPVSYYDPAVVNLVENSMRKANTPRESVTPTSDPNEG